jgi:hypothetical protein
LAAPQLSAVSVSARAQALLTPPSFFVDRHNLTGGPICLIVGLSFREHRQRTSLSRRGTRLAASRGGWFDVRTGDALAHRPHRRSSPSLWHRARLPRSGRTWRGLVQWPRVTWEPAQSVPVAHDARNQPRSVARWTVATCCERDRRAGHRMRRMAGDQSPFDFGDSTGAAAYATWNSLCALTDLTGVVPGEMLEHQMPPSLDQTVRRVRPLAWHRPRLHRTPDIPARHLTNVTDQAVLSTCLPGNPEPGIGSGGTEAEEPLCASRLS